MCKIRHREGKNKVNKVKPKYKQFILPEDRSKCGQVDLVSSTCLYKTQPIKGHLHFENYLTENKPRQYECNHTTKLLTPQ